jgi:two-component system OmpR family response regulator
MADAQGGHSNGRDPEPVMSVDRERARGLSAIQAAREWTRADGAPVRVLVVDDELSVTEVLAKAFRDDGWEVVVAGDGRAAIRAAQEFHPDAVVLDVTLPDFGGLEVLRRLRTHSPQVCVLFLSARDAAADRIAGIAAGADDYVTKPFSLEEVVARLRGLLRRSGLARAHDGDHHLAVADLTMNEDAHEVRRGGDPIDLTPTEFEVLRLLAQLRRGAVKGPDPEESGTTISAAYRSTSSSSHQQSAPEDRGRPETMVQTVRGVGYVMATVGMTGKS